MTKKCDDHVPLQFDAFNLGPSINGLVTVGNTNLCCRGFILALFQSMTINIKYKLIRNIHKIIRGYSWYAKLKYYKLQ